MNDERKKELLDMAAADGVELSDEALDNIAGGLIYHDEGDALAHRKEAYYLLDDNGEIIMKVSDAGMAKHWAGNLRISDRLIGTDEFNALRQGK